MQPQAMTEALSQLDTAVTERVENLKKTIEYELGLEDKLRALIAHWQQTGIAYFHASQIEPYDHHGVALRRMFKSMASDAGRPYITAVRYDTAWYHPATGNQERPMVELMVPKSKRTDNVVAPLFLLTHDIQPRKNEPYYVVNEAKGHDVCRIERDGSWIIWFIGKSGVAQYEAFVERCRTDQVCRIALNLAR